MSADLLAGFDPYYVPPKSNNPITSAPAQATSTINELSFFDTPSKSLAPQNDSSVTNNGRELQNIASSPQATEDDFDGWGDFVEPVASPPRSSAPNTSQRPYGDLDEHFGPINHNASPPRHPVRPQPRMRAATHDFFSGEITKIVEKSDPSQLIGDQKPPAAPPSLVNRKSRSPHIPEPDVLFDADNVSPGEDEVDDFGDFENAQSPPPQPKTHQRPDLLSIDMNAVSETMQKLAMPSLPRQSPLIERNPFADFGSLPQPTAPSSGGNSPNRVITPWPQYVKPSSDIRQKKSVQRRPPPQQTNWDDPIQEPVPAVNEPAATDDTWGWGAETETPKVAQKTQAKRTSVPIPAPAANNTALENEDDAWGWSAQDDDFAFSISKPVVQDDSPPTNVPPPTVLMAFIPDVLTPVQSSLFAPGLRQKISAYPVVLNTLKSYLAIGVVAAHIVAGRKSRWKRDKILSQSMSIGQAGAGGKSGMKLMGVDKAEAAREDREAGDLVRLWKDQVGRLRSAVAAANLTIADHSAHLQVPEMSEAMPVRTATLLEGAMTAHKCCFLCGLKRDERVLKIDGQVEDSFSEWWVDHWGHRACKDFWQEHSEKLKHR